MSVNIVLQTSLTTLDELHKLTAKSGKTCKIDTEILERLLIDHSCMFRAIILVCSELSVKIRQFKLRNQKTGKRYR